MRPWIPAVLILLLTGVFWATFSWVSEDASLFVWSPETGVLSVPPAGFAFLPKWSNRRTPASVLETTVEAKSQDGGTVEIEVRWRPEVGVYPLQPALTPDLGLGASTENLLNQSLVEVDLGCLVPVLVANEDCPKNINAHWENEVAAEIGSSQGRVKIAYSPEPESIRRILLSSITTHLPPNDGKVLVLGLDGLDWDLVLPWIRAGHMPNLQRLMGTATWGQMETLVPTLSPLIWTTMATGVSPDRHGILDFVEKDPLRGVMVPVTGRSRKVPALWNLVSAFGRKVSVVGWWATWPAEKINGVMVSDRLYYTLTQGLTKAVLREDLPDTIYPVQRTQEFIDLRDRAVLETDWRSVRYFMPVSAADFEAAVAADRGMEDPIDGFRRLLASTKTYLGAGLIVGENQPDLVLVYLEGTDTIGHLLAPYMPPPTLEVDPAKADVFRAAVPKYFEIVDRWIGRYLERYPLSEYALLIVSDHGFKWAEGRPRGLSGTAGPTAPLWHDMDAVFLLAGRGVKSLGRVELEASVYDVAPTVLALLGLPADTSWSGTVLPGSPPASAEPIDYRPLLPPESYTQTGGGATPLDPEFITKLKSLGYLGEGARPTQDTTGESSRSKNRDGPEPSGAAANSTGATRGQLNNLAIIKLGEKKYEEAERILRQAIVQSPNYPSPHYNLRRMYMETESYDEADRELWLAVGKGLRDTERTIDRAAADYENLGLPERAAGLLSDAIERYPEHEPFWVHLIVVNIRLGKCTEGERLGAQAVIKFPQSAPAHAFYGLAAACDSDLSRARVELERSLELNPDQETLRRTLAELANQVE